LLVPPRPIRLPLPILIYFPSPIFSSPAISVHVRIIDSIYTLLFNLRGPAALKGNGFFLSSSMKKTRVAVVVLLLFSSFAFAQDRPKWEIFGGYQYTYSDVGIIQDLGTSIANVYHQSVSLDHTFTMTGGNFSIQKNAGKRWAAVLDIGGMSGTKDGDLSQYFQLLGYIPPGTTQLSTFRSTVYTITGGPQFNLLKIHGAQVFVRGMGGAGRSVLGMDDTTRKALNFLVPKFKTTTTDPAVIAGAGVQYRVYHNIFVRGTADYVHPFSSSSQNYFRITGGIGLERLGRLF
jgi:hypothetical protein